MVFDRPDYCFDSEHLTGMGRREHNLLSQKLRAHKVKVTTLFDFDHNIHFSFFCSII